MQTRLKKSLSIIVPTYNEERNIRETLGNIVDAKLAANHLSIIEIIVVNDGSTDRTLSIVEEFVSKCSERDSFTIINCQKNLGVGHAFWIGSNAASSKFITLIPGDGVFSSKSLTDLFSNFSTSGVTLTTRLNKYQKRQVRRIISNLIGLWFSWIIDKQVKDPHSLFVFPTEAVIKAYESIWPTINNDEDERIDFEYHLQITQWILRTFPISETIDVYVSTKLEQQSSAISPKALLNFLKHYGWMTLNKIKNK